MIEAIFILYNAGYDCLISIFWQICSRDNNDTRYYIFSICNWTHSIDCPSQEIIVW